ncbi:MAG: hypothetical protein LCH85_01050 [Chloroflexi bacterium]|nr:hypothetical protein [Chloroflexota bacterium]
MRTAINNTIPLCIGIHWYNLLDDDTPDPDHQGNHVIYAIGYEGNHLYGRDQQHNQLLIKINMGSPNKQSDIFVVGSRTRRRCEVKWLGVGCQDQNQARQLFS